MASIALLVKEYLNDKPFIQEGLFRGIISHGYLAEEMVPYIEKRLGKKIKAGSVMMAIRRYSENLSKKAFNQLELKGDFDITLKSGLCEITILKSPSLLSKVNELYSIVNFSQGGILNIIQGNYEITLVTNMPYKKRIVDIFKKENIVKIDDNLVAVAIKYPQEYFDVPGLIFTFVRALAWDNINICEYVSTLTESIFILYEKDALNAYNAFQNLISKREANKAGS